MGRTSWLLFETMISRWRRRIDVLDRLARVLSKGDLIRRVYAAIDTTKLYVPAKAAEFGDSAAHACWRARASSGSRHHPIRERGDAADH